MATTTDNNRQVTTKEYAKHLGVTPATARRRLEKMVADGLATAAYNCQQPIPRKRYSGKIPPYTYVTSYTLKDAPSNTDSEVGQ
jgi:DeoR/GlpR family transcriptional regulator of sugar metabolism